MSHHVCPCCTCDGPERLVINVNAEFYGLVLMIDRYLERCREEVRAARKAAA